ncbi:MAG: PBP1A family penicillin-binding protein [bacterium]|nr:PBP1A family penicillin-binding protein [bacterium]
MIKRFRRHRHLIRSLLLVALSAGFLTSGLLMLWVSSWKLPNIGEFSNRKVSESTKIYDRTGEVLLYDLHKSAQRTVVPYSDISRNVKNATVAIEDSEFWQHNGIRVTAIFRAVLTNLFAGDLLGGQGGSTITQQVVKNSLLTNEKTVTRKLKEWVLALRLEKALDKETILSLYLNEIPYGGTVYGIQEAAKTFLGKNSNELSIAEAAYLASLPNAPTYYSPYGNHKDKLQERKNLVLRRMHEVGFITEAEYEAAKKEVVTFKPSSETGILAPHFVMYIRQYLEGKYGREALEENGLKVITTLDYDLQKSAESIVKKYALQNEKAFDAENAALSAIDPSTGQILVMVGSRDYFDKEIDGNFNATIAYRQPGSAFKPFVYAAALSKGFTPETIVFDLPTEFSTECHPDGTPILSGNKNKCYKPENYDGKYHGPISFRDALAQSVNVPAIQVLYLAGLKDSLRLAKDMGLSTLDDTTDRYGLTLVLGGGEVKLLELTGAYGAFAAEGTQREPTGILRIETKDDKILEEWKDGPEQVLDPEVARTISDILSDNVARTPAFSANSPLYIPGHDVAVKTGTTNDYRDAWIIGYTPNLAVGAWAGNNDNRPMHKIAAFIVAPLWNEFMREAIKRFPAESFQKPAETDTSSLPPILRGIWQGDQTYFVDKLSGKVATEFTPPELREERALRNVHSILYWIDKNNPTARRTTAPQTDPQFESWEYAVRLWSGQQGFTDQTVDDVPKQTDDLHQAAFAPQVTITNPVEGSVVLTAQRLVLRAEVVSKYPIAQVQFFLNNLFVGSSARAPWQLEFLPSDMQNSLTPQSEITAVATDVFQNRGQASVRFTVTD